MNDLSGNIIEGADDQWSPDELIPFGKYILLDRINSGATAAVYRANVRGEAGFERLVAIKRILPHMAGDRDFVDTFVREAKTVARLTHASICPIYELGKVGESLYMAIEYIQGRDLGHITRRLSKRGETMPPVIAAWITARLCESLDYAHRLKNASGKQVGILHRDLSPSNILVSYEGQVKLIDFGLAKAVGRAQSTNVDALKRKLGYMSPEMVKGRPLDARSDIFGVGVCLYEMITSRRLFSGSNDIDTLKLVGRALVPPPSALVDDAPEELEIIVMHALEREPEDRFQSAAEMGEALAAYLHKADPTFNSPKLSVWMHEMFAQDIDDEQKRIKDLLAASADPELIKRRKLYFASPAGAAARARAEIERRMSTEPPPVTAALSPFVPKAAPLPREAMRKRHPTLQGIQRTPLQPEPATAPPGGSKAAPFEEEPTGFYDADKTRTGPAAAGGLAGARPAPFEDEATGFYDADKTRNAEAARSHTEETRRAARPPPPDEASADRAFEDEPTEFLVDAELEEMRSAAGPFDFEQEATEIFFNKEEGIGIPEMLEEINDVEPRAPLNKPIVAPDFAAPQSLPPAPMGAGLAQSPHSLRPPTPAPPTWAAAPPAPRGHRSTMDAHPSSQVWPLVAGIVAVLAVLGVLVWMTPLGVSLGLVPPPAGSIEVRTRPEVPAAVQLDQVYRGRAPLRLDGVRAGTRRLDITAEGYLAVTREVEVQPNITALLDIALVPDRPRPQATDQGQPAQPQGVAPSQRSPVPGVVPEPSAER